MEQLLDEKEVLNERIDSIEIAMISARGKKLQQLVAELDDLEAQKDALKRRIKELESRTGAAQPAHAPQPQQPAAAPLPAKAVKKQPPKAAKKIPKLPADVTSVVPHKPVVVDSGAGEAEAKELQALEKELEQLERAVEQKEDEEQRLRFELKMKKADLLDVEANVYATEQDVLRVAMSVDPLVRHVVRCQRIFRDRRMRRRWKNGEAALRPLVTAYLKCEDAKPERAKWSLLLEFLRSQKAYVASLTVVTDKYIEPIRRASSDKSGMKSEDVAAMFGVLEVLAELDRDMVAGLQQRLYSRFASPSVGDGLLRWSSVLGLYVDYCKSLDGAFRTLARLQKSSPVFPAFMESLAVAAGRQSLTVLLELPPQRLFQYETIVTALVQLTPPAHMDHAPLRAVQKGIGEALQQVRDYREETRALAHLSSLRRRIANLPDSVTDHAHKVLVDMDVSSVNDKGRTRMRVLLFDDMVVLASGSGNSLQFSELLPLLNVHYTSLPDTATLYNGFELQTSTRCVTLVADSFDSKTQFETAILKALAVLRDSSSDLSAMTKGAGGAAVSRGLQSVRLQGQLSALSDAYARLPAATLDEMKRTQRFTALLAQLSEPATLRALVAKPEQLALAVQSLDAFGMLQRTMKTHYNALIVSFPDLVTLTRAIATSSVQLSSAVALLVARPFLSGCVGKFLPDIIRLQHKLQLDAEKGTLAEQEASLEALCRKLVDAMGAAASEIPPLFQDLIHSFRSHARKRGDPVMADAASGAAMFVALFAPGLRVASRFGFCDAQAQASIAGAVDSVVECLSRVFSNSKYPASMNVARLDKLITDSQPTVHKLLDACREHASVAPVVQRARAETELLPELLALLVPDVERVGSAAGPQLVAAMASAIALSK